MKHLLIVGGIAALVALLFRSRLINLPVLGTIYNITGPNQ